MNDNLLFDENSNLKKILSRKAAKHAKAMHKLNLGDLASWRETFSDQID